MKHLVLINGTMGVGKTAVCQALKESLPRCVFLDGDWCWDMSPFVVNGETKAMVMQNIAFLLNQFLSCSVYDYVLFCWVMHEQSILDDLLSRLSFKGAATHFFTLTAQPGTIRARLEKDIQTGRRTPDVIARSLERMGHYQNMRTQKIPTDSQNPLQVAQSIKALLGANA